MFVSIGEIANLIGVSVPTIRRWERDGKLSCAYRTIGGHRRFDIAAIKEKLGLAVRDAKRKAIAYARVSSHDQKQDLSRQVQRLENHCKETFPANRYEIIQDLGSGLNYKKRGLKKLVRDILSGKVSEVVLTHRDRLLRFGSEIIFLVCSCLGTKVSMIEEETSLNDEQVLAKDVLEIITVFSARLYGKRAHRNKKKSR